MAAPDYSSLFGSKKISDLTIVLQEELLPVEQPAVAEDKVITEMLSDAESDAPYDPQECDTYPGSKRCNASAAEGGAAAGSKRLKSGTEPAAAAAAAAAVAPDAGAHGEVPDQQHATAGETAALGTPTAAAAQDAADTHQALGATAASPAAEDAAPAATAAAPPAEHAVAAVPMDIEAAAAAAAAAALASPGVQKVMPGHAAVLYGCSQYFKTQLENWTDGSSSNDKMVINMVVPPGQLAVGELLLQCMYAAQPNALVTNCSQEQLLQLLLLADRYSVSKVVEAVIAAFANTAPADLQWETLQALYTLPPGCADMEACKVAYAVAGDKLQLELGDLELTWADTGKEELFLALPQLALQQLLQDPRTRVASENTVFHSLERWWQRQQCQQQQTADVAGVRELLQLVRVRHCTGLYVATVLARSSLATTFSRAEVAEACMLSAAAPELAQALLDKSLIALSMPAWKAAERPPSAVLQLDMQWQLPLQLLRVALEQHLQDTSVRPAVFSPQQTWRGVVFELMMKVGPHTDAEEPSTDFGVFMGVPGPAAGAVFTVSYSFSIVAACASSSPNNHRHAGEAKRDIVFGPRTNVFNDGSSRGRSSLLKLGVLSSWQQAESKLRELGLVHSDDCLHIQGLVTDVV